MADAPRPGPPPPSIEDIGKLFKGEMGPIKTSIQNLESQMQNLSLAVDQKFQILHTRLDVNDVRVAKLEEIVLSGNVASGGQVVMQEIELLKQKSSL
jgi:hypothetical protein